MEVELKLALVGDAAQDPSRQLGRLPLLRRRKPQQQTLRNIYFDDAEQTLRRKQVALRIRKVQTADKAIWVQTLKTGASESALSRRGEWESVIANGRLSLKALADTPWPQIDPKGELFSALMPRFETSFERCFWLLRRRGGIEMEVALDLGTITAGEGSLPIRELELELRAGPVSALFEAAEQIALAMAVLPLGASKAERGHALADAGPEQAMRARPDLPAKLQNLPDIARHVLRESFGQFCVNLEQLLQSDAPELVHQARVGWRRFRSAQRLFRPFIALHSAPSWQPLRPLMAALGELRDLDVARLETLAPLAQAFVAGSASRAQLWQAMQAALDQRAHERLLSVRAALGSPETGLCLLATTRWMELADPASIDAAAPAPKASKWAQRKLARLNSRMQDAAKEPVDEALQHRARILAKRLRYGVEALRSVVPKNQAKRWHAQACAMQERLGAERDLAQALLLVQSAQLAPGVADYLRGVTAGQGRVTVPAAKPKAK